MGAWSLLKKAYKEIYTHLQAVIYSSLGWLLIGGLLILAAVEGLKIQFLPPVLLAIILFGPLLAGSFYVTNRAVNYKSVRIRDFFLGIKRFFLPAMGLFLLLFLAGAVIVVDFYFFVTADYLILNLFGAFWIYLFLFFCLVIIYSFPLLIEFDRLEKDYSLKDILKYSIWLTADNLKYTVMIFINLVVFSAVSGITVIGALLLFMGGVSIIANNAAINLLINYELRDEVMGPYNFKSY